MGGRPTPAPCTPLGCGGRRLDLVSQFYVCQPNHEQRTARPEGRARSQRNVAVSRACLSWCQGIAAAAEGRPIRLVLSRGRLAVLRCDVFESLQLYVFAK